VGTPAQSARFPGHLEPGASSADFAATPLDEAMNLGAAFEVGTTIECRSSAKPGRHVAAMVG
jgi:hypothetical protein